MWLNMWNAVKHNILIIILLFFIMRLIRLIILFSKRKTYSNVPPKKDKMLENFPTRWFFSTKLANQIQEL